MFTGYDRDVGDVGARAVQEGANLLVHKPLKPNAMVQLLREVQASPHYQGR